MTKKHWSDDLFPEFLTSKDDTEKATAAAFGGKKVVGVLFSAHWCAPCRAFAPDLALFYDACRKKSEDALEIVFVSSDKDAEAFRGYLNSMPWLAVPYGETTATTKLAKKCKVRGIPLLAIFNGTTGELLTITGRADVSQPGAKADPLAVVDGWLSQERRDTEEEAREDTWWGLIAALIAFLLMFKVFISQ